MFTRRPVLGLEELERRDAPSAPGAGPGCIPIHTTIQGHLTGPTSTAGTIRGGVLRGTTAFSGTFTDAQGDYVGTLVITTEHGTLTLSDQGNLNPATGQFTDNFTVVSGTGRFAGATGSFFDQGTLNLQTGSFPATALTGTICLAHHGEGEGHHGQRE